MYRRGHKYNCCGIPDFTFPIQQNQHPRLSHQFLTKEPDTNFLDDELVEGVSLVTDSQLVPEMQVRLGKYVGARIHEHTYFPATWAVYLSMENIHQLKYPHFVTPKPEGPRFLLYVDSSGQIFLQNMTQHFFRVDSDHAIQMVSADGQNAITDTVLDGIFTREKKSDGKGKLTFVIRDGIRCGGQDLTKMNVFQRIAFVKENVMKPRWDAKHSKQTNENEAFDLDIVECLDTNLTDDYLAQEFGNESKYPLRSLVFFPRNKGYFGGTNKDVFQWTENENYDSVFRLVIRQRSNETHKAELHAMDYQFNREVNFAPIAITEDLKELHGRIVECRYVNGQWKLVRIRNDRPHPHSRRSVMNKLKMQKSPLTRLHLRSLLEKSKGRSQ